MDFNRMNQKEKQRFEETAMRLQMQAFIATYNGLTKRCFNACVSDFTGRTLLGKEENCVKNCVEKYFVANQRISTRFQEQHQLIMEGGNAGGIQG